MGEEKEVEAQFDLWNEAIQSGDPDRVVALYAEDAILIPTLSAKVRRNQAEKREYFVHFLSKSPVGKIDESDVRVFGDIAVSSGLCTFTVKDGGTSSEIPARFTFVYRRTANGWAIVEHHSSLLPED